MSVLAVEAIKFVLVGIGNTAVDFAVFNSLMYIWGVNSGTYLIFKSTAFLTAVINSYVWNKYWVFTRSATKDKTLREQATFVGVSVTGLAINLICSLAVFSVVPLIYSGLSPVLYANIGAAIGTAVVLVWNYLGYKYLVFINNRYA